MSWKREQIPDHKFEFVDENEFIDNSIGSKLSYAGVFLFTLKDVMIYMADLGSVGILLALNVDALEKIGGTDVNFVFSTEAKFNELAKNNLIIKNIGGLDVLFMLIMGSLLLSFVLLFFEWKKAIKIIESRDISYAFTSVVAYRYYAIRSYAHYCLFSQIQNSRKTADILAFFVFFKFKDWKRLFLAQFPRQFLQAVIISAAVESVAKESKLSNLDAFYFIFTGPSGYKPEARLLLLLQLFTISAWLFSFTSLVVAFCIYIPLVTLTVKGNLKEYCVHKVDKRIDELLRRKTRKRLHEARRQERERIGNHSSDSGSDGARLPTLPKIDIDLTSEIGQPIRQYPHSTGSYSDYGSEYGGEHMYYHQQGYTYDSQIVYVPGPSSRLSYNGYLTTTAVPSSHVSYNGPSSQLSPNNNDPRPRLRTMPAQQVNRLTRNTGTS